MYAMKAAKVVKNVKEGEGIHSLYLKPMFPIEKPKPGQFLMVWVPDYEEVPMSVSGYFNDGVIRITVSAVGETTNRLVETSNGFLGIKGPFGTSIPLESDKSYLLIGGGYGVAPLIFAAHELKKIGNDEIYLIMGAKRKEKIIFLDESKNLGIKTFVATEDGSLGFKGTSIDLANEILLERDFDYIVLCGPIPMLEKFVNTFSEYKDKTLLILEAIMKCGLGLCGSCEFKGTGFLVCKDGPVVRADLLY